MLADAQGVVTLALDPETALRQAQTRLQSATMISRPSEISADCEPTDVSTSTETRNLFKGLAFISPWLVGFSVFMLLPIALSLYYSFCDYNLIQRPVYRGAGQLPASHSRCGFLASR